jgi:hypothetical protein
MKLFFVNIIIETRMSSLLVPIRTKNTGYGKGTTAQHCIVELPIGLRATAIVR